MSLQTFTCIATNGAGGATGSAGIANWGSPLSTALAAAGLTKGTDTGQINWATVATPAGANTSAGFEIWKLSDSQQASYPLVFKLEYGSGASYSQSPGLWLTVGTGTDGAGNVSGIIFARNQISMSGYTSSSQASNSYISSDGAGVYIALFTNLNSIHILIERSRNSSGAPTGSGVLVAFQYQAGAPSWNLYPYATPSNKTTWIGSPINLAYTLGAVSGYGVGATAASDPATAPAIPMLIYGPGVPAWILQHAVVVFPGDGNNSMPIAINGSSHTYRSIAVFQGSGLMGNYSGNGAAWPPAMLVS